MTRWTSREHTAEIFYECSFPRSLLHKRLDFSWAAGSRQLDRSLRRGGSAALNIAVEKPKPANSSDHRALALKA